MSEQKTDKITEILSAREHKNDYGTFYYFKVKTSENGVGDLDKARKTRDGYKVGDSITFTIEDGQYGQKFKVITPPRAFGGGVARPAASVEAMILAYSKDCVIAKMNQGEKMDAEQIVKGTLWIADRFLEWIKKHQSNG